MPLDKQCKFALKSADTPTPARSAQEALHRPRFTSALSNRERLTGSERTVGRITVPDLHRKGAIENTNKLVRQYISKGTDFTELTDEFISSVQHKLNRRPRKKLNFSTPKDEFFNLLL